MTKNKIRIAGVVAVAVVCIIVRYSFKSEIRSLSQPQAPQPQAPQSQPLETATKGASAASEMAQVETSLSKIAPPRVFSGKPSLQGAQPAPEEGCFVKTFKHEKISSHSDGEACLRHQNLISLKSGNVTRVCVQVNGKNVHFTRSSPRNLSGVQPGGLVEEFLIGPVAGPNSKVSVKYCIGNKKCSFTCPVAKDEFMSALGMDDDDAEVESAVGWDGKKEPSAEEKVLDAEVAALNVDAELDRTKLKVFAGWIPEEGLKRCDL